LVFRNNAPSLASAADDITALMMVAFVGIAPMFGGKFLLFVRKKCIPARLRAFFSFQYLALLCIAQMIWFALYVIIVSS
jgi:hypothetical protein